MKSTNKHFIIAIVAGLIVLSPLLAFAASQITISSNLPGMSATANSTPGDYVNGFYKLALFAGGILAFGAVVYGGILYAISGANPSGQSEGKSWITSALLGLLLLACAWIILYAINPNLVNLNLPTLSALSVSGGGTGGTGTGAAPGGAPSTATGCAGGQCQTLPNCTVVAGTRNCGGPPAMVDVLNCIQQKDPGFIVTEGYPPTVKHGAACHNNGCCVDTQVTVGPGRGSYSNVCAGVQQLMTAAQQCGASQGLLNEYSGCGGTTYLTTTGSNVHIAAPKGSGGC